MPPCRHRIPHPRKGLNPVQTMLVTALVVIAGWTWLYLRVRRFPWKPCRRCNGNGEIRSKDGRSIGICPKCENKDHLKKRPRALAKMFGVLR